MKLEQLIEHNIVEKAAEVIQKLKKALNLPLHSDPDKKFVVFDPIIYDQSHQLRRTPYIIDQITGVVPYTWFDHKSTDGSHTVCVRYDMPTCVVTLETEYMRTALMQMTVKVYYQLA